MKRVVSSILILIFGGLIGCAGATGPGIAAPQWAVEIAPTPVATVSQADVRAADDQLLLSGTVRRHHRIHLSGHVDVDVIAPDGTVVERKEITVPGLSSARKGRMDISFLGKLESVPPEGSVIRFRYHAPGSENSTCGKFSHRS